MAKYEVEIKKLREALSGLEVSRKRNGNIMIRKGFFYTMGMDEDKFANKVLTTLSDADICVNVVSSGMVWKPFRGGARTANSSHFFVEING